MASVISDKNGYRRIQWMNAGGKRQQIRLGRLDKRTAERVKLRIESLISAIATGIDVDDETRRWVDGLSDQLHERLAAVSLVPRRRQTDLKTLFDQFVAGKSECSENTLRNFGQARKWFFAHFAEGRSIRSVTKDDADAFRAYLYKSLKSVNSANTILKKIKQIFSDAAERELIRANPFKHIKSPIRSNPARMEFVRREWSKPVLRACPDIEWKIIFLMSRYAGVRVPSELQEFTWSDILWDQKRIRIRDAKRSRPGKPVIRIVPMFPELRPVLAEAYEKRHDDSIYICPRARDGGKNLRTQLHRIIKRAGLTPWQRTFQNMRSTRETELAENFPMHVVNKWIGNTESVAVQHYLQVTNDHFDKAVKEQFEGEGFDLDIEAIFEEAAQNQAQSAPDSQDQAKTENDSPKSQAAGESDTYGQSHHKSLSDKDLRIPPRGVEPLSPP